MEPPRSAPNLGCARRHYLWGSASLVGGLGLIGGGIALGVVQPDGIGTVGSVLLTIPMGAAGLFFTLGNSQWQFKKGKADAAQRDRLRKRKEAVSTPIQISIDARPLPGGGRHLGLTFGGQF